METEADLFLMTDHNESLRGRPAWWKTRLARLNELFARDPSIGNFADSGLMQLYIDQGSLDNPPATLDDLAALEARIGRPLCPAYKSLLSVSNGLGSFGLHPGRLLPAGEADWFARRNPDRARVIQDWLAAGNLVQPPYASDPLWRVDIPLHSIEITENYDACSLIMLPAKVDPAGRWQVWLEIAGEYQRYETLPDYMDDALAQIARRL